MTDHEVLGLPPKATLEDVKKRYYQLVKMNHPDKYSREDDQDLWNFANERMTQITESYRRLSNKLKNSNHDSCSCENTKNAAHDHQNGSVDKDEIILKQKIESYVRDLRAGKSSYADIHDLLSRWILYKCSGGFIATNDELANLILAWVKHAVHEFGVYTYNEPAIWTLQRIDRDFEVKKISESIHQQITETITDITKLNEIVNSRHGELVRISRESHFVKDQMKKNGIKIGLKEENEIIDYCKFCRHCCYIQKFLHKEWYCNISTSSDKSKGNLKVSPSINCCLKFERRRPSPLSLSREKLMKYGIIQYALSLGYCYVHKYNIENFGCCNECDHYTERRFFTHSYQCEACALRGIGNGVSSEERCCKSFQPRFTDYYINRLKLKGFIKWQK